jgi:hypothetical protein
MESYLLTKDICRLVNTKWSKSTMNDKIWTHIHNSYELEKGRKIFKENLECNENFNNVDENVNFNNVGSKSYKFVLNPYIDLMI